MTETEIIDDRTARRIAAEWHGGGRSRLLSLATTGYIHEDTAAEIEAEIAQLPTEEQLGDMLGDDMETAEEELRSLLAYVEHHGPRGVQPGWSEIHF